jgi:hypothetical protein
VSSPNEHQAFLRQARWLADQFASHEGVVGVLLTGGAARGHADRFSELDLAVYLPRPQFERWVRGGQAPFPEGDSCLNGWHVDIDYLCLEDELEAEWDHVKRWDRSYAVILCDPRGVLRDMLARKAVLTEDERQRLMSRHLMLYGTYFCAVVVPSWLDRGDVLAAHQCLNVALDSLIRAVFLANGELIPFEKWSLNLSYTLAWTPSSWRQRVEQVLLVREISRAEAERRQAVLAALFEECEERLLGAPVDGLAPIEARKLPILRILRERGGMPAAEFDRRFGLRLAVQAPFFQLVQWETRHGSPWLVFQEADLQAYAERDFEGFLDWNRALLRALVEEPER